MINLRLWLLYILLKVYRNLMKCVEIDADM